MIEVKSRTFKFKNMLVTVHGYSAGTAILHVESVDNPINRASIWVSPDDIRDLAQGLQQCVLAEICKENNA